MLRALLARLRRPRQELHAALGLPQGLQVRHARVDSLRVQARPACALRPHRAVPPP